MLTTNDIHLLAKRIVKEMDTNTFVSKPMTKAERTALLIEVIHVAKDTAIEAESTSELLALVNRRVKKLEAIVQSVKL